MEAHGASFAEVLKEAQALGYAEADPTLDVGGGRYRPQLALLSSLAFGNAPDLSSMTVEGIQHITPADIHFASEFGFRIKLLGVARRTPSGIEQKVHPAMVRARSPLANVDGAANGNMVDAGQAGPFFFSGRGAGEAPTASAVVADLVENRARIPNPCVRTPGPGTGGAQVSAGRCGSVALVSALRSAGSAGRAGGNRRASVGSSVFPSKA